jgi:casein kinase II subunit alpha
MDEKRMQKEALIMQTLCGGPNIIKLYDLIREDEENRPALVMEYIASVPYDQLLPTFKTSDVQYYMKGILKAIAHSHRHDVIHRDIKPSNLVIDPKAHQIRLIDFGLATLYHEGGQFSIRGTRGYKAPEMLLGYEKYDCKIDIWSFGVFFAETIFRIPTLIPGGTSEEQLQSITLLLGGEGMLSLANMFHLEYNRSSTIFDFRYKEISLTTFINTKNKDLATPEALEVLSKTLR